MWVPGVKAWLSEKAGSALNLWTIWLPSPRHHYSSFYSFNSCILWNLRDVEIKEPVQWKHKSTHRDKQWCKDKTKIPKPREKQDPETGSSVTDLGSGRLPLARLLAGKANGCWSGNQLHCLQKNSQYLHQICQQISSLTQGLDEATRHTVSNWWRKFISASKEGWKKTRQEKVPRCWQLSQ